ncbi:MAG: zinc-binding dehydrogenase [Chloroflexi bacterium]|nr:MAG: zinc-binding dehydrogenase [Chloroflexota bacterium]TMG14708.1 MAG: zinc-binding dehydrogenase [Chloroflexota bacterium]TMG65529.1 MAG: zinc-binding dehydrogenase [Chloroflexota bacterium]
MTAPGHLEVRRFPLPDPERGAVLMKVTYSGICGTDKHTFRGESKQYAGTDHERDIIYPLICGHENVGVIEAIGGADSIPDSEGRPLRRGDRIVPAANVPCGHCIFCLNDYPYYFCENLQDYGNSLHAGIAPHLFGGWSEFMYLLPGTPLFRVPDGLPDEVAALTEVMAVTHGFDRARMLNAGWGGSAFGESVAVVGVGPLGFCHLVKARLLGSGKLIAIDRLESRLDLARRFGATLTINASKTTEKDRIDLVREHTHTGADIVIDCTGVAQSFPECLHLVRYGGTVVEAGTFVDMGPVAINPNADICTKNVSVIGVGGETATSYLPAMTLMARNLDRLPLTEMITHRMPLERATEAVELSQRDGTMKVLMDPAMTS